jgi:ubiquinone/menaquinone biosynthesis C-methylase UbiE
MPYFTDAQTRSLVQETYGNAKGTDRSVAEALYSAGELHGLPEDVIALALGVGNPVRHAALRSGEVVLDVGCGAGIDTLLAAREVGDSGRVLALDMTPAMLERTRHHAALVGATNVEVHEGLMEALPFPDASIDVVVTNGVLNLSTRKSRALAEMHRVLRPGGRVALADLVLTDTLPEEIEKNPTALTA